MVVPYREISIAAEVVGRIVEKSDVCRAGNFVTAGTPLVKIDPQDYLLEVERLEKEVQQADTMLDELKDELAGVLSLIELGRPGSGVAAAELKRQRSLSGVVTSSDMERAEANELAARSAAVTQRNRKRLLETSRLTSGECPRPGEVETEEGGTRPETDADRGAGQTELSYPMPLKRTATFKKARQLLVFEDTSKTEVKCKLEMEDLFWIWNRRARPLRPAPALPTIGRAYEIPETPVASDLPPGLAERH